MLKENVVGTNAASESMSAGLYRFVIFTPLWGDGGCAQTETIDSDHRDDCFWDPEEYKKSPRGALGYPFHGPACPRHKNKSRC